MRHLALLVVLSGCVHSYASAPVLPFTEYPYTSVSGGAWPARTVELPAIAERYGLASARVHVVELNPEGQRTLVFLHGLGSYLKFWRYQLDHYAQQGYRVIAFDMLGYGKSEKPAGFPYTMPAMADVAHEVVQALGVRKPVLVGHSMGGQTALAYALQYPEDLSALVLTSPAGFERFSEDERAWFEQAVSRELIERASEGSIWGSIRRANFAHWRPEFEWLIEERVRVVKDPAFEAYAYAQVRSIRGLADNAFVRENLDRVHVPTLIVHGDMDRLIPSPFMHGGPTADVMRWGEAHIAGAKLVTLPGCGHTVQMDCWERYDATVDAFLKDVAPAG